MSANTTLLQFIFLTETDGLRIVNIRFVPFVFSFFVSRLFLLFSRLKFFFVFPPFFCFGAGRSPFASVFPQVHRTAAVRSTATDSPFGASRATASFFSQVFTDI